MKHSALFLVLASLAIGCTEPAPEPEHPVEEPIENPSETPSVSGRVLVGNTIELNSDFSCTYTLKYEHDDALYGHSPYSILSSYRRISQLLYIPI